MNRTQTATLLALAAACDQRTVGDTDVIAWHQLLADIDLDDATTALTAWYRDHRDRITPADLRAAVRAARRDRVERAAELEPPAADPDDVPAYLTALRAGRTQVAAELPARDLRVLDAVFPRPPATRLTRTEPA